jgi:hypothetical protein
MQHANQTQSRTVERKLDQERAQSMADEGGVSGAIVDAHEQAHGHAPSPSAFRTRWGSRKLWAVAALGAGAWLLFVTLRSR